MAQLLSLPRRRDIDPLAAPISAFESETQAVIQKTTPYSEHAILHVLAGIIVLAVLLISIVKLDRVVTGSGKILPTQGSFYVQPLDREIVSSIRVHVGDVVKKGQVLAVLDPTFAQADLKQTMEKKASDEALIARLKAEQSGASYVADPTKPYQVMQASIWQQRKAEYQQGVGNLDGQIQALSAAVRKDQQDEEDYRRRLALAKEAEQQQLDLQAKGFGSRIRVIAATDTRTEMERLASDSHNTSSQDLGNLNALKAQRAVFIGQWRDNLATQLVAAQNDLDLQNQSLAKDAKTSQLTLLTAPQDAVVLNIGQVSAGSVVDPSLSSTQPLFTLTPLNGPVEAEIKIPSRDVGFIRRGDPVRVKLDAYTFTSHGTAKGVVKTISDGSFTTDDNGQPVSPYFKARVSFTDVHLRNVPPGFRLTPGMTLVGDVVVGHRTIMSYLLEGALRTGSEAMREP